MESAFADRSARIIVCHQSNAIRSLVFESLTTLGFKSIFLAANLKESLDFMKEEEFHWLITTVCEKDEINAFHLLKIIKDEKMYSMHTTFIKEEQSAEFLLDGFPLGLLSWIEAHTNDALEAGLKEFMELFERTEWDSRLTSATYLHRAMIAEKRAQELLTFERGLLNLYPFSTELLFSIVDTHLHLNEEKEAYVILAQLALVGGPISDRASAICQSKISEETKNEPVLFAKHLGIETAVIIEPDQIVCNSVADQLAKIGVEKVSKFYDSESAIAYLQEHGEPSLIVMEWKLPKITGPSFIQRIRGISFLKVPIIVHSSLILAKDTHLLKEMSVSSTIHKPFEASRFLQSLICALIQDRTPTEVQSQERKLRKLIGARKIDSAHKLKALFIENPRVPHSKKSFIEAEFSFFEKDYLAAKTHALSAIKNGESTSLVYHVLGKSFMKLREFESAIKCFEKAQSLSPKNIERMCAIAEASAELGNMSDADANLEQAEALDRNSHQVAEASTKVALTKNDVHRAKELMIDLANVINVYAFTNNRAVALSKSGKIEEAINLYTTTLAAIPPENVKMTCSINYNLGLSYIKSAELEKAQSFILQASNDERSHFQSKVKSLLERLREALKAGKPLQLVSQIEIENPAKEGEKNQEEILLKELSKIEMTDVRTICCSGIFINKMPSSKLAQVLGREVVFEKNLRENQSGKAS